MATRKTRLVIAFVLMLSLVSFFSIPASVFAVDEIGFDTQSSGNIKTADLNGVTNLNHYDLKTDVYVKASGYTSGASLYVKVVVPGGSGATLGSSGTTFVTADSSGNAFFKLFDVVKVYPALTTNGYADTTNNGGVYKVLVSTNSNFDNGTIKHDSFKVFESASIDNKYTVTYDANGGINPPVDLNPYLEDDIVTIAAIGAMVKVGYSFVEWTTQSNGDGSSYDPGDTYTMHDHDVTFYAQWERVSGLVFSKEVDPTTVKSKSTTVNYTFTVTNTGIFNLKDIKITDGDLFNDPNHIHISPLKSGEYYTTTVAFNLNPTLDWNSNVFTNIAAVTANYDNSVVVNDIAEQGTDSYAIRVTDSAIVTYIPPTPGLTFTKEVDRSIVYTTDAAIIYTFSLTNTGDFNLYNIKLNDPLLGITNFAIPELTIGASFTTTSGPFNLGTLNPSLDWNGAEFINIASVSASYGAVQQSQNVEIDCTPVVDPQRGSLGPITDSAIVTYMPGTLTIYKDVPEVTEDATLFTFVVSEVVYDEKASTFLNKVNELYTTTVAVSENRPYTIYGLPDGEYQVEELTPPDYYTVSGSAIQYVYIGENGYNHSVTFTNNYYVPPTTTTTTTTRRTRTTTEVVVPEPTPAGPVVTPEVVLDEPVPAAPLPKTGGLDPSFLYGLGALLAGSGLVIKRKKK